MLAGRHDFIIEQGQTWERTVKWQNAGGTGYDLSGAEWTATFTVRPYPGHAGTEIEEITKGSGITLADGSGGATNITLKLTAVETAALDFLRGWYTLELVTSTGTVHYRVLEGNVFLSKEATN